MSYLDQLYPWCLIKPLPNLQRCVIARFRRRNEAEAHLQVIRRLLPHIPYTIVFDPMSEREDDVSDRSVPKTSRGNSAIFPDAVRAMPD
jgi:hypothetical protein